MEIQVNMDGCCFDVTEQCNWVFLVSVDPACDFIPKLYVKAGGATFNPVSFFE
jgi:hypothetical protein